MFVIFNHRRLLFLAIAGLAQAGCSNHEQPAVDPIPALADISAMDAECDNGTGSKLAKFSVPETYWQPILDALGPAVKDEHPAKWAVLGNLHLTLKPGEPLEIFLFEAGPPGAFAIGKTWEQRSYYRGGDSEKLKAAIDQAERAAADTLHRRP